MKFKAFTLAELLIALAILGVIATFTIPKVLTANQNAKYKSMAKEAAGMVSAAYDAYKKDHGGTSSASVMPIDLTQYMNYVSVDVSSQYDDVYTQTYRTCAFWEPCLRLHNGGTLIAFNNNFNGTGATNAVDFIFDPEPGYSSTTNGPAKAVGFRIYYNGRVTSNADASRYTNSWVTTAYPDPSYDPPWFSWN